MATFAGDLTVKEDDFKARFEHLIVEADHIDFRLEAKEPESEDWFIDDRAVYRDGRYIASPVTMRYPSGIRCSAKIELTVSVETGVCIVRVRFEQFEQRVKSIWILTGNLLTPEAAMRDHLAANFDTK